GYFTWQWLNTPLRPYNQPSGPHDNEFGSSWVSSRPKPVTTTSLLSALHSPPVPCMNSGAGALSTHPPRRPTAMPLRMLSPSAKTVTLSALPSASVSSSTLTRPQPEPGSRRGYSKLSVIQNRPHSSMVIATGL